MAINRQKDVGTSRGIPLFFSSIDDSLPFKYHTMPRNVSRPFFLIIMYNHNLIWYNSYKPHRDTASDFFRISYKKLW